MISRWEKYITYYLLDKLIYGDLNAWMAVVYDF